MPLLSLLVLLVLDLLLIDVNETNCGVTQHELWSLLRSDFCLTLRNLTGMFFEKQVQKTDFFFLTSCRHDDRLFKHKSVESHSSEWSCQWPKACLLSGVNEDIWTGQKWSADLRWGFLSFPTTDLVSQLSGSYRRTAGRSSARTTHCTYRHQARDLFPVNVHPFYSSCLTYTFVNSQ